jgi:hypothetical protein
MLPPTGSQQYGANEIIADQGPALLTLWNCKFDGANMLSVGAFIDTLGSINMTYCWFVNGREQIVSMDGTTGSLAVTYKYNLIDSIYQFPGAHKNILQFIATGVPVSVAFQFNTYYQYTSPADGVTPPGEGFQCGNNGLT